MSALDTYSSTFRVMDGVNDVTTGHGVVFSVLSESGCDASINSSTGVYTLSSVTVDSAYAVFRAAYNGRNIDRRFSVAKARQGTGGSAAKFLSLISDKQIIKYNSAGSPTPATQTTTFSVNRQNTTNSVTWTVTDIAGVNRTPLSTYLTVAGDTLSATMTEAQFASARNSTTGVIVTASITDGTTFSDKISVSRVEQGDTGATGNPGLNNATVALYQRASSPPSVPGSTLTYTFATGVLSGTLGSWSQVVPAGTNPVYKTLATASSSSTTDTIATGEWSSPVVLVQDGATGATGPTLSISPDKGGFTYSNGALTPSSQTITYTALAGGSSVSANWTLKDSAGTTLKSATASTTFAITNTDIGSNAAGIVSATYSGVSVHLPVVVLADRTATPGATWGSNIGGVPTSLTDGRVAAALDSAGDLARPIIGTIKTSSNILSRSGGGTFTGALTATENNVTRSSTAPSSPVNGDIWVDTSVTPNVLKTRVSGAWQSGANFVTQGADIGVANNASANLNLSVNSSNATVVGNSVTGGITYTWQPFYSREAHKNAAAVTFRFDPAYLQVAGLAHSIPVGTGDGVGTGFTIYNQAGTVGLYGYTGYVSSIGTTTATDVWGVTIDNVTAYFLKNGTVVTSYNIAALGIAPNQSWRVSGSVHGPGFVSDLTLTAATDNYLDNMADGANYARLPVANSTGTGTSRRALIDFTQSHSNKNVDNIADGSTYARPLASRLSGGKPVIDFSEAIHPNKNIDHVADGLTYARVASAELSSGIHKLGIAGSGKQVGDARNLPNVTAMNLGYKWPNAPTYSATTTTATISVAASTVPIGSVNVSYNAMSVGVSGSPGTTVTYYLYLDDPTYAGGAATLNATTTGTTVYQSNGRVYVGAVPVTYPASGTGGGGGYGGGGGGGGGPLP